MIPPSFQPLLNRFLIYHHDDDGPCYLPLLPPVPLRFHDVVVPYFLLTLTLTLTLTPLLLLLLLLFFLLLLLLLFLFLRLLVVVVVVVYFPTIIRALAVSLPLSFSRIDRI